MTLKIEHSEQWMQHAIGLTENCPQKPFASVIVDTKSNLVVAEGWNRSSENSVWHGEIDALNRLAESRLEVDPSSLVLYTTAEPCAMCQSAILWARIRGVVFGTSMPTLKAMGWHQIEISAEEICRRTDFHECVLLGGVLERTCDRLFQKALSM